MKLAVRKSNVLDDWYLIEKAEHDGRTWLEPTNYGARYMKNSRISDADVEGSLHEMKAIAKAIRARGSESFKRCFVSVEYDGVHFCSPRNSTVDGIVTLEEADDLASQIEAL